MKGEYIKNNYLNQDNDVSLNYFSYLIYLDYFNRKIIILIYVGSFL